MEKCCDNPTPGYGAPLPGEDTTEALCGTCGHTYGPMTPEKAAELFKRLEVDDES
jgi:hypothetical protein